MANKSIKQHNGTETELQPRVIPEQKRAEQTVTHILDTAALLLDEVGVSGFNTNRLAERADIRIATVYRYFPNKFAILSALVLRWMDTLRDGLVVIGDLADPKLDWRKTVEDLVDAYVVLAQGHVGFMAIRRTLQATPELREIEMNFIRELSLLTVKAMQTRGVKTEQAILFNFSQTFMVAASSAVDLAWIKNNNNSFAADIIEQVKVLSISFFANHLD